jgi:phosphinothricin acetyltransferase
MSNGPRSAGGSARPAVALREAGPADLPEIQAIYAHHVAHGLASFELEPPDLEEMTRRHQAVIGRGLPYLVAELEGRVRGFASAGPYRPRPAYRYTLENTVYVDPAAQRQGIGEALLAALIERCTALGYRRLVAVIGDSANRPSIRLHEKLGFQVAGRIPSVGFKFGRWVDSVILQRPLGEGDETLPD